MSSQGGGLESRGIENPNDVQTDIVKITIVIYTIRDGKIDCFTQVNLRCNAVWKVDPYIIISRWNLASIDTIFKKSLVKGKSKEIHRSP